jgi:hypothetical protein
VRLARLLIAACLIGFVAWPADAGAESGNNFADRQQVAINNCPVLSLSNFWIANTLYTRHYHLAANLAWKNVGSQPITAFEIGLVYFDPFNRRLPSGGRWLVPGKDSAHWTVLRPGDMGNDKFTSGRQEYVFSAFAFVADVRFADGSVWTFDPDSVRAEIQKALPAITDFGAL